MSRVSFPFVSCMYNYCNIIAIVFVIGFFEWLLAAQKLQSTIYLNCERGEINA